ncbi:MAG: hypothetical protein AB7V00_05215 [Bacilli bacterium]
MLWEGCVTCSVFTSFDDFLKLFAINFFNLAVVPLRDTMNKVCVAWILFSAIQIISSYEMEQGAGIKKGKDLIWWIVAVSLMQANSNWWFDIIQTIFDYFVKIASMTFVGANVELTSDKEGIEALIQTMENGIVNTIGATFIGLIQDFTFTKLGNLFLSLPLVFCFVFLFWKLLKTFFMAYLKLFGVAVLAPFLVAFIAIESMRKTVVNAIRLVMVGGMQVVLASAAGAMILFILKSINGILPEGEGVIKQGSQEFLGGQNYFVLLITTAIMIIGVDYLVALAPQILDVIEHQGSNSGRQFINSVNRAGSMAGGAYGASSKLVKSSYKHFFK